MLRSGIAAGCVVLILAGSQASACGESLFRVGKGVIYREYTAPLPGKILIVASADNELAMVEILRRAGHEMHVVATPEEVGDELASGHYDIVMSHYRQHDIIDQQLLRVGATVARLPVASTEGEASQARQLNRYAPMLDDSVKRFLKAIHRTLKEGRV